MGLLSLFPYPVCSPVILHGYLLGGGSLRPLEALHLFLPSALKYHLSGNYCACLEVYWLTQAIVSGT